MAPATKQNTMLQIKIFNDPTQLNEFLKSVVPEAVRDIQIKIDQQNQCHYFVFYDKDRVYHSQPINDDESNRAIDLIAHQADRAWNDIDEEAGSKSLSMAISMLVNQTLAYYFPNSHPLSHARSTISTINLDVTITPTLLNQIPNADGYRIYEVKLNTSPYDQATYGYVLAGYYQNDPNYNTNVTHLIFLDNNFNAHGNSFDLDASAVPQWRLI